MTNHYRVLNRKFCIAVQDGDKELLALLNEGLAIAVANGTYDELYNKWFSPILPQPPVPFALILKHLLFALVPILFLLGIVGRWYLKREVAQKTQSLNKEIKYRKQAGEALQRSEEILKATGRMAKVGGWELDGETLEVRWTEETYRIYELTVGHRPSLDEALNFFHPEDRPKLEQAIQRALEHGEPYDMEIRFTTAKGKHLWTHTVCKPHVIDGKTIKLTGTFQDISERKLAEEALSKLNLELEERIKQRTEQLEAEIAERIQAEETLRKNKEMLQMIFDGISDPLLMLNANLKVRLLNKAASEYYFVDQKSVLGKPCYQAFRGRSAPCEGCQIQSAILNRYYEMFERKGLHGPH